MTTGRLRALLETNGDAPFLGGGFGSARTRAEMAAAIARADESAPEPGGCLPVSVEPTGDSLAALLGVLDADGVGLALSPREPVASRNALTARAATCPLTGAGTIIATSGSTGAPKLAVHSLDAHLTSAVRASAACGFGPGKTWLLSLPLHHVGGLQIVMRAIVSGGALVAGPDLAAAVVAHRPTHISLVATQLRRLLGDEDCAAALRAADMVLLGGGPVAPALREEALDAGVPIAMSYGSTESTAFTCIAAESGHVRQEDCAGRPLDAGDVRISDSWEIEIRGPTLFSGYLDDGELRLPLTDDGWFQTGDLGRIENGVLFVEGRRDRQFISGGENVHPERIEAALRSLPGVTRAVVVAVPDAEFGMRPAAFLSTTHTAAHLEDALRAKVPGYMVPAAWYELPDALTGRIKPALLSLAEMARDPATSQLRQLP